MFTFENLSFRYRDFLFEGYNDHISDPKIGIVGKNGSGKTTMLRLLDGQLHPQEGAVRVDGSTYLVDFELRRYRHFTIDDMIALCRPLASFDTSRVDALVAALELTDYLALPIGELSKGVTKKVSLLLGLMATSDVLLVDEPFESIDAESNANLIHTLRSADRGLVVVSHDVDHLRACVDVLYRVEGRKLVRQ